MGLGGQIGSFHPHAIHQFIILVFVGGEILAQAAQRVVGSLSLEVFQSHGDVPLKDMVMGMVESSGVGFGDLRGLSQPS